ncbi:NAD-P-binding protein [Mycena albidolilacea]|uniref:NAD-P-binding protein n=1 Tax=Mycena albidolilacea TaxID=1033008 RepID=A0AAD6ZW60_9AGAR|nr:NAD-P-binding protein [Mycena albidolilacea]
MSLPTITFSTTAEHVAAAFAEQIRGKNVLITGTSMNGIDFEAARVLAKYVNLVIITGYNSERLKLSEEAIKKEVPGANIRQLVLDLSSLTAVRKAAAEVNQYSAASCSIGPFLLTKLFVPKLLAARSESYTPRVVTVSSGLHAFGSVLDLGAVVRPDPATYATPGEWYIQAKSANILFASELARRAQGKITRIFTNILQKEETKKDMIAIGATLTADGLPNEERWPWKTLGQGAATTLVAAVDTRVNAKPNAFLWDCVEANDKVAPHCADPETAAKLWTITEELVGEKFTF